MTNETVAQQQREIKAGLHQMSAEAYHADPAPEPSLSSTIAKIMLAQSPRHAWTASSRLNPDFVPVEKKTFDIGRAAHRAVLGAGGDYAEIPADLLSDDGGVRTKEAKAYVDVIRSEGKTPLKPWEIEEIELMREILRSRMNEMGITLDPACSEQVAFAQIDGVWCRAMLDNVPLDPRQPIYDFKTCENASPDACMKSILNYGYDVQAAHYRQVWNAATGQDRAFRFIFQEKAAPHEICIVELGSDSLMMAGKKIARAREMWGICLRTGEWPGYPRGVHRMELPEWVHTKWLERESAEADHKQRTGRDVLEAAMRFMAPEGFRGENA